MTVHLNILLLLNILVHLNILLYYISYCNGSLIVQLKNLLKFTIILWIGLQLSFICFANVRILANIHH